MAATAFLYLADLAITVAAGEPMPSSSAAAILLMGVFAGSAALGIDWVLAGLRTKLILHADAIEAQGGLRRRRLRRDEIAGRWTERTAWAVPHAAMIPSANGQTPSAAFRNGWYAKFGS